MTDPYEDPDQHPDGPTVEDSLTVGPGEGYAAWLEREAQLLCSLDYHSGSEWDPREGVVLAQGLRWSAARRMRG